MKMRHLLLLAGLVSAPALVAAQETAVPTSAAPQAAEDEGGLTGSVSDENEWQDLGIAIPAFPTNASVSTAPWGAKLAHSMNVAGLKRAFAGLLLMLGTYMLYRSFSH